ncbi:MAG: hypothetical protein CL566_05410 [Alphaproteobacteria bacterium]|nr:hypothetical protein [Alphaproteobacteria bacterium]
MGTQSNQVFFRGVRELCRRDNGHAECFGQPLETSRLIDRRTDHREIEPPVGPDIALDHLTRMQRDTEFQRRQIMRRGIHDGLHTQN